MPAPSPRPALHSLAEAYFYARVTPCAVCGGLLDSDEACFAHDVAHELLCFETTCRACGAEAKGLFDATALPPEQWGGLREGRIDPPWMASTGLLNVEDEPSRLIDVAGWLTLFTWLADAARSAADRATHGAEREQARRMRLLAASCLDEALQFYDPDNDLPPDEAFFHDVGRRQFWEHPEWFTRQHLADLRSSLMRAGNHHAD